MVQIPRLSADLTNFYDTLRSMANSKAAVNMENQSQFEIQTFDSEPPSDDLISVADESIDASMAYIQQEYSDLSSKYQMVLQMLEQEQHKKNQAQAEHQMQEKLLEEQLESLRQQFSAFSAATAQNSASTSEADEKLGKLKNAYQKLRQDHIGLLRQKGEVDKHLQLSTNKNDRLGSRVKLMNDTLTNFFKNHGIDFQPSDETDEKVLQSAIQAIDERIDSLQVSLVSKEQSIRQLEDERMSLSKGEAEAVAMLKTREADLLEQTQVLHQSIQRLEDQYGALTKSWAAEHEWRRSKFMNGLENDSMGLHEQIDLGQVDLESQKALPTIDRLHNVINLTYANFLIGSGGSPENVNFQPFFQVTSAILRALENGENIWEAWNQWRSEVEKIKKTTLNFSGDVDGEISRMQSSISEAAAAMEKLMMAAKANETKKRDDIDVDLKILDSCSSLIFAIEALIKAARELQAEITSQAGSAPQEFYRRNQKWSQGLISAAKDIGSGAKCLVEAADGVVSGTAKFEELIVASQEIAASSAQLVLASRVKAKKDSERMETLSSSSKSVASATATVIATCRSCASQREAAENSDEIDLKAMSVHQTKRLEMEAQIKVLELETLLEKQREKLFAIRKHQYAKSEKSSKEKNEDAKEDPK